MGCDNNNHGRHHGRPIEEIQLYKFVSPQTAIRGAVGNLGMGHLVMSLEEDLLRWAGEANEKIVVNTKAEHIFKPVVERAYTKNGRIKLCNIFDRVECAKLNNREIHYEFQRNRCQNNKSNNSTPPATPCECGASPCVCQPCYTYTIDGCWLKIHPECPDEWLVTVEGWAIPIDDEGYFLLIDGPPVTATTSYVSWQMCIRQRDNRATTYERIWYANCKQARAFINKRTQSEIEAMGAVWFPQRFSAAGYRHYARGYNYDRI